ncbi:MAG: L-threonylcarbamoyladenylate synthase [Candidatus Curtissbacteria bacterium]
MNKNEGSKLQEIKKAAQVLKKGGVVIFPTDTVYGIGCLYDDKDAIRRIYRIKKRPPGQPFPYLVSNIKQVEKLAVVTSLSRKLMDQYWPGGLTIILPSRHPELVSGSKKIGFRMPDNQQVLSLIDRVGVPIIGTSANFHGQPSTASSTELDPKLRQQADFVIEGKSKMGTESTVIDTTVRPPKILRLGAVNIKI